MLVFTLLLSALGGMATHLLRRTIDDNLSEPYRRFAAYGTGVLAMQPFIASLDWQLRETRCGEIERHIVSNVIVALLFGCGVMGGYFTDHLRE